MADHFQHYIEVPNGLTPAVERAVAGAVAYGRRQLGITAAVTVGYFMPSDDYEQIAHWPLHAWLHRERREGGLVHGCVHPAEPTKVFIRATLGVRAAAKTALHELVHVVQMERSPNTDMAEARESVAEAWAQAHWPRPRQASATPRHRAVSAPTPPLGCLLGMARTGRSTNHATVGSGAQALLLRHYLDVRPSLVAYPPELRTQCGLFHECDCHT